jgi:hypothetical protein
MRLPGGKKNQAYRTYAVKDPVGIFVNAYGRAKLAPTMLDPVGQGRLGVRGAASPLLTLTHRFLSWSPTDPWTRPFPPSWGWR